MNAVRVYRQFIDHDRVLGVISYSKRYRSSVAMILNEISKGTCLYKNEGNGQFGLDKGISVSDM